MQTQTRCPNTPNFATRQTFEFCSYSRYDINYQTTTVTTANLFKKIT